MSIKVSSSSFSEALSLLSIDISCFWGDASVSFPCSFRSAATSTHFRWPGDDDALSADDEVSVEFFFGV